MFDPFPYELSIKDSNHLPKILSAVSSITFDKSVLFLTFLESTRGLHERITREDYTRGLLGRYQSFLCLMVHRSQEVTLPSLSLNSVKRDTRLPQTI